MNSSSGPFFCYHYYGIITTMKQEDLSYYSQTIKEGIGLSYILLGKSNAKNVYWSIGKNCETIKHREYSYEIKYKNYGTSFYYRQNDPNESIFAIVLRDPRSGKASGGIQIGKNTMEDVVNEYGPPFWVTTDESDTWWIEYPGIEFHVERESALPHYPLNEAIHLKKKISGIVIKEFIPGILNPAVKNRLPKVFISYCWESQEHVKWVWHFVQNLLKRHVDVVFDRYHYLMLKDNSGLNSGTQAGVLAQKIAYCHVFMPIFTPRYIERVRDCFIPSIFPKITIRTEMRAKNGVPIDSFRDRGIQDGWVFDEVQQFIMQHNIRKGMPIAPILRAGKIDDIPVGLPKNIITDLSSNQDYKEILDALATLIYKFASLYPIPTDETSLNKFFGI